MAMEIERKFLVQNDSWKKYSTIDIKDIEQHYLDINDFSETRIRHVKSQVAGKENYFMTIKTKTEVSSQRHEREFSISPATFADLSSHAVGYISKTRYIFQDEYGQAWELDVFKNENTGIEIVEIELPEISKRVVNPGFLGKDVTNDDRFYNKNMVFNT